MELIQQMPLSSPSLPTVRRGRALGIAVAVLGLLALATVAAGGAQAADVKHVQSYSWASPDGSDENTLVHTWEEIPHEDPSNPDDTVIPSKGLALVAVNFSVDNGNELRFRFLDQDDNDDSEVDEPNEAEFVYDIGQDPDDERDDRVHVGAGVTYSPAGGDRLLPTKDGCRNVDLDTEDLSAGTADDLCWFLIELTPPGERNHLGQQGLEADNTYNLEVEVQGAGTAASFEEENDGENVPLHTAGVDTEVTSARFTNPNAPGLIETGESITFNLTLEETNASDHRPNNATDEGDVDTWACLYRESVRSRPNVTFGAFTQDASDWDENPDCDFYDVPAHGGDTNPDRIYTAYGETRTSAVNITRTDENLRSDGSTLDQNRTYEYQFTLDEEVPVEGSSFVDEFFIRVIVRDAYGNVEYHILDDDYVAEQDTSREMGPGVFQIAEFDLRPDLEQTSSDDVDTFEEEEGCFQTDAPDRSIQGDIDDNSEANPCTRRLELLPPYDEGIEIPFIVNNHGNAEDIAELDLEEPSDPGSQSWDVSAVSPDGSEQSDDVLTYDIAAPSSPDATETSVPRVVFQPPESAVAPDARNITVEVESDRSRSSQPELVTFQARLAPKPLGEITLGPNDEGVHRFTVAPDERTEVAMDFNNTGNTDGPFDFGIDEAASDDVCSGFNTNPADPDQVIDLDLIRDGAEQNGIVVGPGGTENFQIDADVGRDVATAVYDCEIFVEDRDAGENATLTPNDPTLEIEVAGETDIRVFRTTDDEDRDEIDLTRSRTEQVAAPDADRHQIVFYLENTGSVALDARLETPIDELLDAQNLQATWKGIDRNNETISLSEASEAFRLPVSDEDDRDRVEVSDVFREDGSVKASARGVVQGESPSAQWDCAGQDTGADADDDPRVLCRLEFSFDYSDDSAVIGDHVVYDFEWNDPGEEGDPSNATVELRFDHAGRVVTDTVTQRVAGTGDTSRATFDARLNELGSFDTDEPDVDANLTVEFVSEDGTKTCTVDNGGAESGLVSSSVHNATEAEFPVQVTFEQSSDSTCSIESPGSDGRWDLPVTVSAPSAGTATLSLAVEDEEGSLLRQVSPAHVRTTGQSESVQEASLPTDLEVRPNRTMQANGSQYARLTVETTDASFLDAPALQDEEGILVSRAESGEDLTPYSRCSLDGVAATTDDATRGWTRIPAGSTSASPELNEDDAIPADTPGVQGVVFREGDNDDTVGVGQIEVFGWGDGRQLRWQEGWNPIVLRVEDASGDVVQPPGHSNAPDVELTLKFGVRNASGLAHTFELSSQDDAIPIQALGQGYYRAHVFLPDGLPTATDTDDDDDAFGANVRLSDHPREDDGDVAFEAWALHAEIESGESVDGQDVSGDAYWRVDQIGLADGTPDPDNGTAAASLVRDGKASGPGGRDVVNQTETDTDLGQDRHESTRTFVHTNLRFLGGPLGPDDAWTTGPGTHRVSVFVLEETDDGQRQREQIENDELTAKPFHEHTFEPVSDASGRLLLSSLGRSNLREGGPASLNAVDRVPGLYDTLARFPDTGSSLSWLGEVSMKDADGTQITPSDSLVFDFRVDPQREPAADGIPLPLCVRPPNAPLDASERPSSLDRDDDAGDFDVDSSREEVTLDLRSIPGLRPDRLDFAFNPVIASDSEGIRLLDDDDELYDGSRFTIEAPGQVDLDPSLLPSETESGRDLQVRVPAEGPVGEITAELAVSGESTRLEDADGDDGVYTGGIPVTEADEGNTTLEVTARDASGGVSGLERSLEIVPNTPPQISVVQPSGANPAIPSNGSIVFAVDDAAVESLDRDTLRQNITVERGTSGGGGADLNGSALSSANVNVTGMDSRVATGATPSITVNVTNDTGAPASGTVYVNVSGTPQFNATLTDGEADGDVAFPDAPGDVQMSVELNGTDAASTNFTVTVVDTSSDGGFQEAPDSEVDYEFQNTTVRVTYSPDLSGVDEITARALADLAGEDPANPAEVTAQVDNDPPSLTVTFGDASSGSNPTVVGPSTSISARADDELTGVASLSVEPSANGTTPVTVSSGSLQTTVRELGITGTAPVTLTVRAEDEAGNGATETRDVRLDETGPDVASVSATPADGAVSVTASVTDDGGVQSVLLFSKAPDQTVFGSQEMAAEAGDTYRLELDGCGDGRLEYYVQATDRLGNREQSGSRNNPNAFDLAEVECEPVSVSITSPGQGDRVQGNLTVDVESTPPLDDGARIESFTITDGRDNQRTFANAPAEVDTTELADGSATVAVTVSARGQTASDEVTIEIANAGGPPSTEALDLDATDDVETSSSPTLVQSAPHPDATSVYVVVSQDGREISNETFEVTEDGRYRIPQLAPGTYDVTIQQVDDGGRAVKTSSARVTVGPIDKPTGTFVATLVVGLATVGAASYAAFGRWG